MVNDQEAMPFEPFLPKPPGPPQGDSFASRTAKNLEPLNRMVVDDHRYIGTFRERRIQVKDDQGNPIVVTVLVKLEQTGTAAADGDYDFKVTTVDASGSSGHVAIADGLVQDSDLSDFATGTPQDPVPTKVVYQFPVTGNPSLAVTDGQTVYLRYTMATYGYYSYRMNVALGNAVDGAGGGATGGFTDADGKIFNNGTATVDFVALSGAPPDSPTIGHIRLATVHITGGVMSFTNSFPRHIVSPLIVAPCRTSPVP